MPAAGRCTDITKLLLKYGADPNRRYKNGSKSAYRALQRGRIDYVVTLLEENALEIESDPMYKHFNVEFAELAHIAADYYASSNEKKAMLLYKQAINFYPAAIKEFEWHYGHVKRLADNFRNGRVSYALGEKEKLIFSLNLRPTIKESDLFRAYDLSPYDPIYYSYIKYECEEEMDLIAYFMMKVKHSERSLKLSKTILTCYEENKPGIALINCVKSASENNKL